MGCGAGWVAQMITDPVTNGFMKIPDAYIDYF